MYVILLMLQIILLATCVNVKLVIIFFCTIYFFRGETYSSVLRLLLLYHEPELCSFLDTKRISPDQYTKVWMNTLFAGVCSLPAICTMWDLYFMQADPFFMLFLSLIMIINAR